MKIGKMMFWAFFGATACFVGMALVSVLFWDFNWGWFHLRLLLLSGVLSAIPGGIMEKSLPDRAPMAPPSSGRGLSYAIGVGIRRWGWLVLVGWLILLPLSIALATNGAAVLKGLTRGGL
jgi:hypothetical protein